MKKITLILMLGMIAIAGWAAEKPFLGWRCTDLAALKAAVTDADVGAYRAHVRIDYELMIAEIEAPDTVNTLAKMESFVSAARERYLAASPAYEKDLTWNPTKGIILQYFLCRRDTRFLKEIMADSEYTRFPYYEEHYVARGFAPVSYAERRTALLSVIQRHIARNLAAPALARISDYIEASIDDDDDVVVKDLKKFYRLALPKLTAAADDPWKPVVAKIQLALKSRGAEVK